MIQHVFRSLVKLSLAVVVAAVVAHPVRAEVRLLAARAGSPSQVRTVLTPSGAWTAVGEVDAGVLNERGDREGDGAPALASAEGVWLAAWSSPARGAIRMSRGTTEWSPSLSVRAEDTYGTPLVLRAQQAWVVATRLRDDRVGVIGLTDEGRVSEMIDFGPGRLVGGASTSEGCQLVFTGRDGCMEVVVVGILVPDPQPIELRRSPVCFPTPRDGSGSLPRLPRQSDLRPSGDIAGGSEPPPDGDRSRDETRGVDAPADPTVHHVLRPDGSASVVLTRWQEPQQLDVVVLDEYGDVEDGAEPVVRTMTVASGATEAIDEVLREVRGLPLR